MEQKTEADLDLTRWAIVSSTHGEKYIGNIPGDVENGAEYFNSAAKAKTPVRLQNVRLLLTRYGAGAAGIGAGLQTVVALLPIDLCDGPLEEINVVPSSWYSIPTTTDVVSKLKRLLDAAEKSEENNRLATAAKNANLTIPGGRRGSMEF
jgi:hypothetical protein